MRETIAFTLEWDNSKLPIQPVERWKKRTCTGKKYANGAIELASGAMFTDMAEMEYVLALNGKYEIQYQDEKEQVSDAKI